MGRRTWIKIYTDKWLRGSLRKEGPETRSLFVDLLALAGDSAYGDNGIIQLADKVGFTDETIAGMLNVPLKIWIHAREILSNHNIPAENRIKILPLDHGFAIEIINWNKYQSEYQRQKPTRTQEKEGKVIPIVTDEVTGIVRGERERDIEGDRDIDKDNKKISKCDPGLQSIMNYALEKGFSLQGSQKQNRLSAYNLLRKKDPDGNTLGVERVKQLIDIAIACRGEKFAPMVNDFVNLYKKWQDLLAFVAKKQKGGRIG